MGIKLVTGAAAPLTAADVRLHCSIDASDTSWDGLLTDFIAAASSMIEEATGKAFGAQVWLLTLDAFPEEIVIPRGPVTGITSITYFDSAGSETTLSSDDYLADLVSDPCRILPTPGISWPATQGRNAAVSVTFQTGYADVPAPILQCIRATVVKWFETRDAVELPAKVIDALEPWGSKRIVA